MVKIKVSKQIFDDDLYIHSEKLKIKNKSIQTPIRAFSMNNLRNDTPINNNVKGVNEFFSKVNKSKLKNYVTGEKSPSNFHKNIRNGLNKTSPDEINFCFISLPDYKLPEGKEIDVLTNMAYFYSDAIPLPLIQGLFKEGQNAEKSFDKFTNFMKKCIDSINRLNNKPILGTIPSSIPPSYIEFLVDFYHDFNITSFAFDFQNKTHIGTQEHLRELMIAIIKLDILNESFTYSCNTQRGKSSRRSDVIKANDMMVYNYGFDIVGESHMGMKIPPDAAKKINERNSTGIRLFNSEDYGHYKYENINSIKEFYPKDKTNIPIEYFNPNSNKSRSRECQKLFNSEMFGLELLKYSSFIKEGTPTIKYLETKSQIKNDLIDFKLFRDNMKI